MTTKRMLIVAAGSIAAVLAVIVAIRGQAITVAMTSPEIRTVQEYIAEDGKTRLANEYTIDMPINGTVERMAWNVGDVVEKGAIVVRIDPYELTQRIREIEAQIAQRVASITGVDVLKPKEEDIASAEIHVREMRDALAIAQRRLSELEIGREQARRDFERAKSLIAERVVSQSYYDEADLRFKGFEEQLKRAQLEIDNAEKGLRVAELAYDRVRNSIDDNEYVREEYKAQVEGLKAQRALLKNDLGKTEICAPVTGPILEKMVDDRRVLAAGTIIAVMGDMASIEIEADVLSEEIAQVAAGQRVEIYGKALRGAEVAGVVDRIYPAGFEKISALGVEQQRVKIIIAFNNDGVGLRPGTRVDVRIITAESKDVLAAPDRAVFRQNDQWSVFRVVGGRARLTPIEIGLRNDQWTEVRSGLTIDDTIVAEPKNELADGMRVSRLK